MSPFSRLILSAAGAALLAPVAEARQGDPVADVLACRRIEDIESRLACFDASAARLETARQAGDIYVVEREAVEAVERDSFGFNLPSLPRFRLPAVALGRSERPHDAVASADQAPSAPAQPAPEAPGAPSRRRHPCPPR